MIRSSATLTPEGALSAALLAAQDVQPGERLADVHFGTFADESGRTGAYWCLRIVRQVGNTRDAQEPRGEGLDERIRKITLAFGLAFTVTPIDRG